LLLYTLRRNVAESLSFLTLFWGLYAASRLMTIMADGQLGAFGTRWLLIEGRFLLDGVAAPRFATQASGRCTCLFLRVVPGSIKCLATGRK
jgi:hypothetical protein